MKQKKVLVIGDLENTYIRGFITRFLKPCGFDVNVKTDIYSNERKARCRRIASELGIKIIEEKEYKITKKLTELQKNRVMKPIFTALKGLLYTFYKLKYKMRGEYDFVHVHYLYYEALRNAWRYKASRTKMIASWWGSDLFRKDDEDLEKCWRYLKDFDLVTTDSIDLEKGFFERVVRDRRYNGDYKRLYLGSEVADYIDYYTDSTERVLVGEKIPNNKVLIAVGYNGNKAQQHLKVIDSIKGLDTSIKKDVVLLLQMTYGVNDDDYIEQVMSDVKQAGFDAICFDKYLSNEEVASIRACADIFINAQTTDAFCSTIKEYMYAKTEIINAIWLEYKEFEEWKLETRVFADFAEVKDIVESIVKKRNESVLKSNRDIIGDKFTWDRCSNQWLLAYNSI